MSNKYIFSDPHNGLCNKLRNLISSMRMSNVLDIPLVVRWVPWGSCGASISQLFTNDFNTNENDISHLSEIKFVNEEYINPEAFKVYDVVSIGGHKPFSFEKNVRAWTSEFWRLVRPYFFQLKPVSIVSELVTEISKVIDKNTIGVHIRRGDHSIAHRISKTYLFMDEMWEKLDHNKNATFYMSTECDGVLETMREEFEDRIIVVDDYCENPFRGIRNSHHAMRISLIEMLLLSKTSKIIGSARSSFSTFPAIMGNIPFKRMGSGQAYADDHYIDMNKEDLVEVPCH